MSIPHMTEEDWVRIKDEEPIQPPHRHEGCWDLPEGVMVLYLNGGSWTLVAMEKKPPPPPPPPDLQGRMSNADWQNIKHGKLIPELNVIEQEGLWQLHYLRGRPGRAVPVLAQRTEQTK